MDNIDNDPAHRRKNYAESNRKRMTAQQPVKMDKTCPNIRIVKKRLIGNKNRTTIGYCGLNDLTCEWVQQNLGCPRTRPHPPAPELSLTGDPKYYFDAGWQNGYEHGKAEAARAATLKTLDELFKDRTIQGGRTDGFEFYIIGVKTVEYMRQQAGERV